MREIDLIFLNACHSEGIALKFLELGIKCAVVVQEQVEIHNKISKEFSLEFYSNLMNERTIRQAFDDAVESIKLNNINMPHSCCCHHKHKKDCKWDKMYKQKGRQLHDEYHVPFCKCPRRHQRIHKMNCKYLQSFENEFDCIIEEQENTFNTNYDESAPVCCCSPEIHHDETMKFKLISRQDLGLESELSSSGLNYKDVVVFPNLKPGTIHQLNKNAFTEHAYNLQYMTIGQNSVLYKMYDCLTRKESNIMTRIVYL